MPDPECSEPHEREAHRVACEAWDRGEQSLIDGPTCLLGCATYAFGLGTFTFEMSAEDHERMYEPLTSEREAALHAEFDAIFGSEDPR